MPVKQWLPSGTTAAAGPQCWSRPTRKTCWQGTRAQHASKQASEFGACAWPRLTGKKRGKGTSSSDDEEEEAEDGGSASGDDDSGGGAGGSSEEGGLASGSDSEGDDNDDAKEEEEERATGVCMHGDRGVAWCWRLLRGE